MSTTQILQTTSGRNHKVQSRTGKALVRVLTAAMCLLLFHAVEASCQVRYINTINAFNANGPCPTTEGWAKLTYDGKSNITFCMERITYCGTEAPVGIADINAKNAQVDCAKAFGPGWTLFAWDASAQITYCMKVASLTPGTTYISNLLVTHNAPCPSGWAQKVYNGNSGLRFCAN